MSSSPGPRAVRSSKVPAASSSSTAAARARIVSVLSIARCMARPTSAISSPTPVAASEICTCASAAENCALTTSFLVRKASTFKAREKEIDDGPLSDKEKKKYKKLLRAEFASILGSEEEEPDGKE